MVEQSNKSDEHMIQLLAEIANKLNEISAIIMKNLQCKKHAGL
jgi:uncharacterized protein YejL (UPF0352 family)